MTEKDTDTAGMRLRDERLPEPWLRGTLTDIAPVERAVIHALELAREDIVKWCSSLEERDLYSRPLGLPSIAFHLLHIARSLNRFTTYADGEILSAAQLAALANEAAMDANKEDIFRELDLSLRVAGRWLRATMGQPFDKPVRIGRKALPTTRGGLLVHMAEHTQRHVGQAVTTAKALVRERSSTKADALPAQRG